eukprot:10479549-Lingulodinium_polyedra.AAC.1
MAALRGAARGRPRAQPLSSRTPCTQRAGMSKRVLTATGRGRCWGRSGRWGRAALPVASARRRQRSGGGRRR